MPGLLAYAREFYKCDSLEGVPLENGGTPGSVNSHWEKLFMPNEYMNPAAENPGILTTFSLLFL